MNNELVGILGNYAYRVLLFIQKNFQVIPDGIIIDPIQEKITETIAAIQVAVNEYRFKEATDIVMQLASFGNTFFQQCEPWKSIKEDPKRCERDLYQCLQLLKAIAVLSEPTMPTVAERLWLQLGQTGSVHDTQVKACLKPIKPGTKLQKPQVLFDKIPDETIEKMSSILDKRIESARAKAN